jgi:hypothetical protein
MGQRERTADCGNTRPSARQRVSAQRIRVPSTQLCEVQVIIATAAHGGARSSHAAAAAALMGQKKTPARTPPATQPGHRPEARNRLLLELNALAVDLVLDFGALVPGVRFQHVLTIEGGGGGARQAPSTGYMHGPLGTGESRCSNLTARQSPVCLRICLVLFNPTASTAGTNSRS